MKMQVLRVSICGNVNYQCLNIELTSRLTKPYVKYKINEYEKNNKKKRIKKDETSTRNGELDHMRFCPECTSKNIVKLQ